MNTLTPTITARAMAATGTTLPHEQVQATLHEGLGSAFDGKRVLVLIPDHTRSLPCSA